MLFVRRFSLLAAAATAALGIVAGIGFARPSSTAPGTGVVAIETMLGYERSAAAGTGIVLTPSGEVLTNNHVIRGATVVRVAVPGTGRSYPADVVGYSVAADVAVLQLRGASGLRTASLGHSAKVRIGQVVTAVGNAGGTGSLAAATGRITGRGRSITATDEQGSAERLTGLLETDAAIEPGDSGGPLLDAEHRVVGIDTAASAGFSFRSSSGSAYAIPIDTAAAVARQITSGRSSASVHVGATPFLGVQLQATGYGDGPSGGLVAGVVGGSPAATAGIAAGDVITAVGGRTISSPQSVSGVLLRKSPGNTIRVVWTDQYGTSHSATVTLASGPPQ